MSSEREGTVPASSGACGVCGGRGWHTAGGNDPAACGACSAGEAWQGGESAPAPSDEAVEAATQAIAGHDIWRAFDADARAVLPWWLAKEAVGAAAPVIRAEERAATLRALESNEALNVAAAAFENRVGTTHGVGDGLRAALAAVVAHFNPEAEPKRPRNHAPWCSVEHKGPCDFNPEAE